MSTPMMQSRFPELVRKSWDKVTQEATAEYPELQQKETLRGELYTEKSLDSAFYEEYRVSGIGDIPRFPGSLLQLDNSPGYGFRIEPGESGAYVELERKLWHNNLYDVMKNWKGQLMVANHRTKEKAAIKGYARLNSSAFDFMTWNEEGVPIASTAHTTKNDGVTTSAGGYSNLGTSAFDPTIVEATRIIMRGFRGLNGEILFTHPDGLIGPTTLDKKFEEVNATPKGLYSAEGTVNVQAGKWQYKTSQLFNDYSTKNWIMVDWAAAKKAALWLNRMSPEDGAEYDFMTKRMKFSLFDWWGYGFAKWQPFYFMQVA
jgi:hypothetical protein